MLAISNPKRTIYSCNLFQKGPNMLAIRKSSQSHVTIISWWISRKQNFDNCKHIWSQSKDIASILGPLGYRHCKHIWSLFWPWLQAYLVPVMKIIATICGPALYFENDLKKINPFQIVFKIGSSSTTIVWSWSWSCSVSSFCTKSYCEDKSSVIGDVPPDIKT